MTQLSHHLSPTTLAAVLPNALHHYLSAPINIEYLGQGSCNRHWRLSTADMTCIWREFGPTPPGANRDLERRVLAQLQGHAWVPELLLDLPEGLLFRASPGAQPLQMPLSSTQRSQLLSAVLTLWQQPIEAPAQDYPALIRHYASLAERLACPMTAALIDTAQHWNPQHFCLIHQDIHPGNLLLTDQGIQLIDWEYAVCGNPWIDAVALDRMLSLSPAEKQLLQEQLPTLEHADPWVQVSVWLTQLDQLWHQAQTAQLADSVV